MEQKIDVNEYISFLPETGKILLNNQRIVIFGADSLGTLRRDLISVLGLDRAKGFLLRYGWNCGLENADTMKSALPYETELDWVTIGPKIHDMTGQVKVKPIEISYDPITGDYYAEGLWHHSYEAEQHIKHFGYHHEPVCFTLTGHAGGYVSRHLGKKVIFKEVECIGKGDQHCRWIGRLIQDWGDEIQNEAPFYEEENLALKLETAYKRIENQNEMFKRVLRINEQLSRVLLKNKSLLSIITVLGRQLKTAVIIEDKDFNLLESFGPYKHHRFKQFIENQIDIQETEIKTLMEKARTVQLSIPSHYGWSHQRLISPIIANNQTLGYISLIGEKSDFDEFEFIALEHTSTICAIQLLNEKTTLETEQRIKGELLDELITGNLNIEDMSQRMRLIGHDLNQPHFLLLFDLRFRQNVGQGNHETLLTELKKEMAETIYTKIKELGQTCLLTSKLDQIITLVSCKTVENLHMKIKDFGLILVKALSDKFAKMNIILGISSKCNNIKGYKRSYEDAKKAVELSNLRKDNMTVITFEELSLIARICNDENLEELQTFALDLLGDIVTYDQKRNSELLKTLYYFFENQGNVLKTARTMLLSAGSIKYRIKKFEEISNLDLASSKDFFDAQMALQILLFLGIINLN